MLLIPWFEIPALSIPLPGLESTADLHPFGLLAASSAFLTLALMRRRARKVAFPEEPAMRSIERGIGVGILSAYVLNGVFYQPEVLLAILHQPSQFFTRYLGLSSFGGFLGGSLAALHTARRSGISLLGLADVFCYVFPLPWAIARSGCFVAHDHPGLASDFFLAIDNYQHSGVARHDLGLYEMLWSLLMVPLFWSLDRRPRRRGFFVVILLLSYAPARFGLDFLRASSAMGGDVRYWNLTPAQYGSLALLLLGSGILLRTQRPADQAAFRGEIQ